MIDTILSIFVYVATALFCTVGYYRRHHVFHRKWKVGDFAWYRYYRKSPWQLVQITDEAPSGCSSIVYIKVIHGPVEKVNGVRLDEQCCGKHYLSPIRWWQRNKADPIIMKHFLLEGM